MKKKDFLALVMIGFALVLVACGGVPATGDTTATGPFVGISMPTQSSARWISDGNNLSDQLQALGFRTTLQFAEDVVEDQVAQIESMILQGVDVLVIAAVDGASLTGVLAQAHQNDIYVIAYDRLLMNSPYVSYYATFDNFYVGIMQGQFIVDALGLSAGATGPFNIELFAGSPDDNNAWFFFNGAMSVLEPFISNGSLVVRSGQDEMSQVATLAWNASAAQARMDNLITAHYATERLDAVLSPYDGISLGIISALRGAGYGTAQPWPVITGQDALIPSIRSIIEGEQTQTIFKDTRVLAARTVDMIEALLAGEAAPVNDTVTYDNGVIIVPTYLIGPVQVTIANWYEVLVDSGFYTAEELS